MQPNASSTDSFSAFPFLTLELELLKDELPVYLAQAVDVASSVDPLDWWNEHASCLPKWASAARKVLLVHSSSATSERMFSMLRVSFGEQQDASLQDYVETSLMLHN